MPFGSVKRDGFGDAGRNAAAPLGLDAVLRSSLTTSPRSVPGAIWNDSRFRSLGSPRTSSIASRPCLLPRKTRSLTSRRRPGRAAAVIVDLASMSGVAIVAWPSRLTLTMASSCSCFVLGAHPPSCARGFDLQFADLSHFGRRATSPAFTGPTPCGVPVKYTSPG